MVLSINTFHLMEGRLFNICIFNNMFFLLGWLSFWAKSNVSKRAIATAWLVSIMMTLTRTGEHQHQMSFDQSWSDFLHIEQQIMNVNEGWFSSGQPLWNCEFRAAPSHGLSHLWSKLFVWQKSAVYYDTDWYKNRHSLYSSSIACSQFMLLLHLYRSWMKF